MFKYKFYDLILFVFSAWLMFACQSDEHASIKGHVEGARGKLITLVEVDTDEKIDIDQKKPLFSGRFKFSVELNHPKFYELQVGQTRLTGMILKPGQAIQIHADLSDINNTLKVDGSPETESLIDLEQNLKQAGRTIDSLYALASTDTTRFELIIEEVQNVQKTHRRKALGYIINAPSSFVSLAALYQQYDSATYVFNKLSDLQYFKMIADSMVPKYPRSKHVRALQANTKNLLNNYQNFRISRLLEGRETTGRLPDITLPDRRGDSLSLSSLRGKYVLLSFWSANSKECIQYNLALQPVYKKYSRNNFEVYQVSVDTSSRSWLRALRYDEIDWYSVRDQNNYFYTQLYNVQQLPYNLLIDPGQTEVIAKNMDPKNLDAKLKELLN